MTNDNDPAALRASLHSALVELTAPSKADTDVPALVRRIEHIKQAWVPRDIPKMLHHYLEKRSYLKALDFLEGRDEASEPAC